ncbi:hypothetical protein R1sor_018188 [Riccia sorocarpa]|uniref:Uncharacterized protein n=1 Tax=Riccia sorocarpa TaxID=122646 RepID=A0ABD3ID14_9MARC
MRIKEKKQDKSLTAKQKKDMWDLKVREVCGTWYNVVFKYATIVNPNLGPEFLSTVRELHNSLSRQPKAEREVVYNVGVDRVKAFAAAGIHKDLKLELLKAHYSNAATKAKYHHPVANDIEIDIRPWLAQWSLWSNLEVISQDLAEKCLKIVLSAEFMLEDLTDRLDEELTNFIAYFTDVRDTYWEKIWKEAFESLQHNIKEIEATTANKKDVVAEAGTSTAGKKSRGKKPLTEDDDLADLLGDKTLSAGDSTKRRKVGRNVNISSSQSPWYTPKKDYRLPVYAEDVAAKLAELPQTPSQTSVQSENESSESMVFIDDDANVDARSESSSAVTMYLSSDEELFKDD